MAISHVLQNVQALLRVRTTPPFSECQLFVVGFRLGHGGRNPVLNGVGPGQFCQTDARNTFGDTLPFWCKINAVGPVTWRPVWRVLCPVNNCALLRGKWVGPFGNWSFERIWARKDFGHNWNWRMYNRRYCPLQKSVGAQSKIYANVICAWCLLINYQQNNIKKIFSIWKRIRSVAKLFLKNKVQSYQLLQFILTTSPST